MIASLDPWCTSQEGLDDQCHFCESYQTRWDADLGVHIRSHWTECPWVLACESVQIPLGDGHEQVTPPPHGSIGEQRRTQPR